MSLFLRCAALLCLAFSWLSASARPPLKATRAINHSFERPIDLAVSPQLSRGLGTRGLDGALIAEQGGWIYRLIDGAPRLLIDLSAKISQRHNEEGLLGLVALKGRKAPRLIIYYTAAESRHSVLAELTLIKAESPVGFKVSEVTTLLKIAQPYGNHNGGGLALGPRETLFVGVGDGGAAGDPRNKAQDLSSYLGKILRLDVSRPKLASAPKDNPFVNKSGARPVIWAYGLRNPWRISVDPESGALWAGDVGQDRLEEVDLIRKGENLGWKWREGDQDYQDRYALKGPVPAFIRAKLVDPVVTYSHEEGRSITGGHVYRGVKSSPLYGMYLYADFVSGRVWGVDSAAALKARKATATQLAKLDLNIASFARDHEGELYVLCFDGGVYKLDI